MLHVVRRSPEARSPPPLAIRSRASDKSSRHGQLVPTKYLRSPEAALPPRSSPEVFMASGSHPGARLAPHSQPAASHGRAPGPGVRHDEDPAFPVLRFLLRNVSPFSLIWVAGLLELVGGALVAVGLFTRCAAFVLGRDGSSPISSGTRRAGFYPALNEGVAGRPLLLRLPLSLSRRRRPLEP